MRTSGGGGEGGLKIRTHKQTSYRTCFLNNYINNKQFYLRIFSTGTLIHSLIVYGHYNYDYRIIFRVIEFLIQLCEQLYPRYNNQNTVGVIWTLLNHVKSRNGIPLFNYVNFN